MYQHDSYLPLNRAQRRAAERAERRRTIRPVPSLGTAGLLTPLYILDNARPHEPGEKAGAHLKTMACFERCRDGTGDEDDFDHVAMILNICKVRALDIDATLADMIERAQDAMVRAKERYVRLGRFGFDGPGLTQVADALDAAQQIIDASTPLQMRSARRAAVDAMLGKGAWKKMEREGALR